MLRMTPEEFDGLRARIKAAVTDKRRPIMGARKRASKFGNRRIETEEGKFDSEAEHRHWCLLRMRESAGEISDLKRQVVFELAPSVVIGGRKRPPLRYVADMVYQEGGETVVADVKGAVTDAYRIKRHLMAAVHGIEVMEVRA